MTWPALIFRHSRDGVLKLTSEALETMLAFAQRDGDDFEAGGFLLGRLIRDCRDVIVDSVTTPQPGDQRSRFGFIRNGEHQDLLNAAWREQAIRVWEGADGKIVHCNRVERAAELRGKEAT